MNMRRLTGPATTIAMILAIAACGGPKPPTPPPPQAPPAATPSAAAATPALPRNPSPAGASVSILSPANGATVTSPVKVVFGVNGMVVVPAGDNTPNSGHYHLLIDVAPPDFSQPIPKDDQHLHFGKGQTEAEVVLAPGQHSLQLLFADGNHVPHDPPVISDPITITVQ